MFNVPVSSIHSCWPAVPPALRRIKKKKNSGGEEPPWSGSKTIKKGRFGVTGHVGKATASESSWIKKESRNKISKIFQNDLCFFLFFFKICSHGLGRNNPERWAVLKKKNKKVPKGGPLDDFQTNIFFSFFFFHLKTFLNWRTVICHLSHFTIFEVVFRTWLFLR